MSLPLVIKTLILVPILALAGCGKSAVASRRSPYEHYLPQTAPSEANRVTNAAGFSIVIPPGWTTRTVPIEAFPKDWVLDEFVVEGTQTDAHKPKITIQRLRPAAQRQWDNALQPGWKNADGYVTIPFQGQTALSRFLPGFGRLKAERDAYQPWLLQTLVFKSKGQWFSLAFAMRNADEAEPYYTHHWELSKTISRPSAIVRPAINRVRGTLMLAPPCSPSCSPASETLVNSDISRRSLQASG
jgi:hypothetical protein